MDTGGDRGERPDDDGGGSGISRRRFVAGGIFVIGGGSMLVDGSTRARFADEDSVNGTVQIDGNPTLHYQIYDNTENTNAQYDIAYQVEWVNDFDRIELTLTNTTDEWEEPFSDGSREGTFSSDSYGGEAGDTFEFVFEVIDSTGSVVINESTTDIADGDSQGEGDFGNGNSPELEQVTIIDNAQNTNTNYVVEYQVGNLNGDYDETVVTFDNTDPNEDWDTHTDSDSSSDGSISYDQGGTMGDEYDITVEVKNNSGLTVDSVTITDTSDGTGQSWSA